MKIFAETPRLILREMVPEDAAGMFALDSDLEVVRYLGGKPMTSIDQAMAIIDYVRKQYVEEGIGRWAIIEKESGQFIGWAGLKLMHQTVNGHTDFHDVGYRLLRSAWGRGYATEAAKASVAYGFQQLGLETLYAAADIENTASWRVLQKAGLQQTGTFDHEGKPHSWHRLHCADWLRQPSYLP